MIAVFLAPFYLLLNYYVLTWLLAWARACCCTFGSLWFRIPVILLYSFLALSPLSSFLITAAPWHRALKVLGNYWLGTFSYILLTILLFDAARRLFRLLGWADVHPIRPLFSSAHAFPAIGFLTVFCILAVSAFGILHARRLYVREYPICIEKSCGLSGLRLVLVSHLHLGYNSSVRQVQDLAEKINAAEPDLVCIAGDIFDNEFDAIPSPDETADILAGLQSRYGVYACYGNHDVSEKVLAGFTFSKEGALKEDPRFPAFLKQAGIHVLEDEVICIDGEFYLAGRKDPSKSEKEGETRMSFAGLTEGLDRTRPLIVMDHQPKELSQAAATGVDLDLSGHTHDGQIFPGNLMLRLFWENPCGIVRKGSMYSVVTSGAGVWGPAMRVGTDSEILVLDISFH